jgi:methylmalonyl-CoA mutase cobalamin-binding subunit
MNGSTTAAPASPTVTVPVAVASGNDARGEALLDRALESAGFWSMLSKRRASSRKRKNDLSIAIKPDVDVFVIGAATGTDPELVEALVARIRRAGYQNVTLCDGRNKPDRWLHNRDGLCVPDLIGYHFEAPPGEPYNFAWVDDDPRGVPLDAFDTGETLFVNGAWAQADVRISFAKAKTDDAWGYALTAANLLGLVSTRGDAAHWSPEDTALQLLRVCPPHFALIDAVTGSHGRAGSRVSRPIETGTVIASPSALLADWHGALKMGADPYVSPLNARALERLGLPDAWTLDGDASPWHGWENPSTTFTEAVRQRARWPELDAFVTAVLQMTDREHFPFRDVIVDQVSSTVLSRLDRVTDARVRDWIETMLASVLAFIATSRETFSTNVTQGDAIQSLAPITLDLAAITRADFDDTARIVATQARVLDGIPEDGRGFRFRTVGGHIHFAAHRLLPLDFADFVSRVDVSASIRNMNDYVGGSWRVIDRDAHGRPTRQAERNIYLPQPNWTGVFGGDVIDVEKLEVMRYTADAHRIDWRTVSSPNASADSDDGSVAFVRTPAGQVDIRITARQRFRLPTLLAAARIERWSGVHGALVADAYGRFFDGTIANLRAAFDGRAFRIGKPPTLSGAMDEGSDLRALLTGAAALVSSILGWGTPTETTESSGAGRPVAIDDLGFAHFAGQPGTVTVGTSSGSRLNAAATELTPMTFLAELGRAVGKDIAVFGASPAAITPAVVRA